MGDIKFYSPVDFDDTSSGVTIEGNLIANANVGIGTTSPSGTLEVSKGGEGQYFKGGGDNASNVRGLEFSTSS